MVAATMTVIIAAAVSSSIFSGSSESRCIVVDSSYNGSNKKTLAFTGTTSKKFSNESVGENF